MKSERYKQRIKLVYLAFVMSSVNQISGAVSRLGQALEQTAGVYERYEKEIAAHAALYE